PDIQEIAMSCIKPSAENPRDIASEALSGLRSSLEKFGYIDLLIVNKRNMELVAGHQRFKVLQEAGIDTVTCVMVDVDDMMQQSMNVTLNNQAIAGYWTQALIPILERLKQEMPEDYVSLRLKELRNECQDLEAEQMGNTLPDDIPPTPKEAITKPGDLWILGDHRLLCGSSTNSADVCKLMDGQKAQLLATDPPYMVDYTGADRPNGGKDWSNLYREVDIPDAEKFYRDFYTIALQHIDQDAALYLWHADRRLILIRKIWEELGLLIHQHIIWVKPCTILTFSVYPWRHEPCVFGWRKGSKPFFRPSEKRIGSVWFVNLLRNGDPESPEYYSDLWEVDWEGKKRNSGLNHPTVKPTEIFAIPMRVHTKPGDICYEPFSGSGSQIIAAERFGRRCFAMELEPVFCDVAVRRWEEFTGRKAERYCNE
ncbi:MAG: DNA modification methylase, partial [Candidatus Omnitrophica bacterium]|nr:DNA modification methylase [Candidatus Omnitrophota bacterium]